ncbi:uncharacterized protein LOC119172617 [Rhipicephalus microplus]|uniref:Putative conserved secreted protein n=1 Tax=Rhipicephalus microplus TaxID=6941 RepID=A0A6G5A6A7_RHIMP
MIRGSLLLLLTFAIFAQAFGYTPTYRFRFLKSAGRPPKPFKLTPKSPQPTTRFIGPVISFRAALPPVLGLRPMAMPMPMPMPVPMPIPMVPASNFIGPNPGGVVAAFVTPAVGAPNTALGFVPGPLVPTPRLVQPVISPHQNFTLLSKHSSGPSVTATVFRAPGGLSATSVQRVEGTSTSLFRESDTAGAKTTTTTSTRKSPPLVRVPVLGTARRMGFFPVVDPPIHYFVYEK